MPNYMEAVNIDGSQDQTQLTVEGNAPQTQPLQQWQTSGQLPLGRMTGDGRLQVGSFSEGQMATDEALVELHRSELDTSKPKRGLHLKGALSGVLNSAVTWVMQELKLLGSGGISAVHTAQRVKLENTATGAMTGAVLRGAQVEVQQAGGSVSQPVPEVTGVRVEVGTVTPGVTGTAYGVQVVMNNSGVQNQAYALHTQGGVTHLGEYVELEAIATPPAPPASGRVYLYVKSDGALYAKTASGSEYNLLSGAVSQTYSERLAATQSAALVEHWRLSESSGTTMVAAVNSARQGTYTSVQVQQSGIGDGGQAVSLDGSAGVANFYTSSFDSSFNRNEGTLLLWVQVADASVWTDNLERTLVRLGVNQTDFTLTLRKDTNNNLRIFRNTNNIAKSWSLSSGAPTGWLCLALTWSVSADAQKFYLNGSQLGSTLTGLPSASNTPSIGSKATLGAYSNGDRVWKGRLAHLAVWSVALTPSEIAALATV